MAGRVLAADYGRASEGSWRTDRIDQSEPYDGGKVARSWARGEGVLRGKPLQPRARRIADKRETPISWGASARPLPLGRAVENLGSCSWPRAGALAGLLAILLLSFATAHSTIARALPEGASDCQHIEHTHSNGKPHNAKCPYCAVAGHAPTLPSQVASSRAAAVAWVEHISPPRGAPHRRPFRRPRVRDPPVRAAAI